jgi:hypothetical protein
LGFILAPYLTTRLLFRTQRLDLTSDVKWAGGNGSSMDVPVACYSSLVSATRVDSANRLRR